MPSSVRRSMRIRGHSAMVAIRATTGRFNLRTTGRAMMSLTVKEAFGMAKTGVLGFTAPFQARKPSYKFTNEYTPEKPPCHAGLTAVSLTWPSLGGFIIENG